MDGIYPFVGQSKRDPILKEGNTGPEYNCLYTTKELTCKPIQASRDLIGHTNDGTTHWPEDRPRGMKHFPERWHRQIDLGTRREEDHPVIAQKNCEVRSQKRMEKRDIEEQHRPDRRRLTAEGNLTKPWRDPITGRGMGSTDYLDLLKLPKNYPFRSTSESASSRSATISRPPVTRRTVRASTITSPVRSSLPSRLSRVYDRPTTHISDNPVVKKVIRPKPPHSSEALPSTSDPMLAYDTSAPNLSTAGQDEQIQLGRSNLATASTTNVSRSAHLMLPAGQPSLSEELLATGLTNHLSASMENNIREDDE